MKASEEAGELMRFAFNQARFAFYAAYTIERMEIKDDLTFDQALAKIRETENGKKYLMGVSDREMREEMKEPGTLMDKNTPFGRWLNDEYGNYIEDFEEK